MKYLTLIFLLFFSSVSIAAKNTGTYSNLRYSPESGDLLGMEMSIIFSNKGYWLLYQNASGVPKQPVLVPIEIQGDTFNVKFDQGSIYEGLSFTSKFTETGLKVTLNDGAIFNSGGNTEVLPKTVGYWFKP